MKSVLLFALFIITKCSCQDEFSSRPRNFSLELLHFTQLQKDGHVVISPFGVWTLMTGVALGTMGNSYAQLSHAFFLPSKSTTLIEGYKNLTQQVLDPSNHGVSLTSKNYMFLANDFRIYPSFQKTMSTDFGAMIKVLNFKDSETAARLANNYIQSSGGKVSNVLKSDDFAQSRMILTNVISFKGVWSQEFNKSETTVQPFYDETNQVIGQVNMMYQSAAFPYSNIQELKANVLEIPYGSDNKYSMLVILPYHNGKVADVYKRFATISLKDVYKKLQDDVNDYGLEEIGILLPRFKISTNVVLNKPLNDMGVYDIFEPEYANFAGATTERIFVSAIIHKADIEVTETGTVASAATYALISDRIYTPPFKANRPFIYFIMEKPTTTVLFGGIYSKPSLF